MQKEWIEQFNTMGKTTMDSLMRLNQISTKSVERFTTQQMAFLNDAASQGLKQVEILGKAKSPVEFMTEEAGLATTTMEKMVAATRDNLEIISQAQAEMSEWLEEAVASTVPGVKRPATKKAA